MSMKTIFLVVNVLWFASQALGQNVGDKARLESTNPKGVPVHASASDACFVRRVNGTLVKVVSIDGKWFHVSAQGKEGWVTKNYDADGFQFKTMSPEHGEDYPPTRMAGVPLFPRSRIDYILALGKDGGIIDGLVQWLAQVHTELLPTDFNEFRKHIGDHIPVTVRVKVVADDD
jgi:hypothetical protein